jgi:SHS2 domain-containing protein
MIQRFEILEHPADVGFRAYGQTLEELFANAALALITIAGDPATVEERERREIEVTGEDTESLLYAWLAEIVAVADADRLLFCRVEVTSLGDGRATGVAYGEPYDRERHRAGTAIKAVTYHRFMVQQSPAGWIAEVFLDV